MDYSVKKTRRFMWRGYEILCAEQQFNEAHANSPNPYSAFPLQFSLNILLIIIFWRTRVVVYILFTFFGFYNYEMFSICINCSITLVHAHGLSSRVCIPTFVCNLLSCTYSIITIFIMFINNITNSGGVILLFPSLKMLLQFYTT